ncbi:MAG: IS200/IS605 family transposase [Armatimonadia bacterium]
MPQSFLSVHVHLVFGTKSRARYLTERVRPRVHEYLGGIASTNGCIPVAINGPDDHVHLLVGLGKETPPAQLVKLLKVGSSRWIHDTFPDLGNFAWQTGYGMFGVSVNGLNQVARYINNQAEHHREISFQEEYRSFLMKQGVAYDERYLWD